MDATDSITDAFRDGGLGDPCSELPSAQFSLSRRKLRCQRCKIVGPLPQSLSNRSIDL
jgi:hypothetical protein